ncbi:BAI1-associated protein 3-like isoform X2 [Dendronephthya gigantea]|uniref:BAI1-associated protein 3-like isoform X2 n=1 Tax=Dendronephthya gigantea TaxID=151771 RepID=UPI00106D4DDE|nr:BAI1-associated protein 3-like isoform X2 [Dendronephthya gigantea]
MEILDTAVGEVEHQSFNGPTLRFLTLEDEYTNRIINDKTPKQRALHLDDAFFEKITELDWKKQSLRPQSEAIKNLPSSHDETDEYSGDDDEVKQAATRPPHEKKRPQLDREKSLELYSQLLFVTINQFVSEQQRKDAPLQGEIYVYGQEVFGITQDKHRELFSRVKELKPPTCHVEVKVLEARDIEAKDANGFSDPYCMLGVVTDNSFDRKLRRKSSKTKTVTEQLEEDLIKLTSVKKKTLNPTWNETITLKVNDVMTQTLHLDMWDQDEDDAFLDKDNRLTQIKGVAGVGRFLKQVVQSSRKCSGSTSMDDFLGFVEFPIKDIPSSGIDQWFPLQARSAKSTTRGDCHLVIRLVGHQNNNNSNNEAKFSPSRLDTYGAFLKTFVTYDGRHAEDLDDVFGSGDLSRFAQWILHQYVIQNNITLLQRAVCEWEVYSAYHQTQPLKYSFLEELLSRITYNWKTSGLSVVEEETFHQSLDAFLEHCLRLIDNHRTLYPATESGKLSRLNNMLNCIKTIQTIPNYCASRSNNIEEEIRNTIKISAERWYTVQYAWFEPKDPTLASAILSMVSLSELIVTDLLKALKFYTKIFKEIDVDYFSLTYLALEKLLASDMRQSISKMEPQELQLEVGDGDLGTKLLSLYLAAKEIMEYSQYLPLSQKTELAFDNSHVWFKEFIDHWFKVAKKKALARIAKAVEIDQAMVVDTSVKYSTSAVDVTCCFYQLCQFWKRLRWPDATGSYLFVTKLTDDICEAARYYADTLETKLKKNDYYDDNPSYFGVSESLCITLNNLAYTQQWLDELETHLDWPSIISGMMLSHNEREAKKCEETLKQLSENAQDVLLRKIDDMIDHIGEKMSVDIKRFVSQLVGQDESVDISEAMDPLLSYLEKSMRTFYSTLVRPVFDRTLLRLWTMVVDNISSTVGGDKGKPPIFYERLNQVVEVLIDFFCVDGIGIPLDKMMTDAVKVLIEDLLLGQLSTEKLIEEYYAEKMRGISAEKPAEFGELALRMFYDLKNGKLHIELLNGRNLPALDSNGYCDPYVKLRLAPRHLFPTATVERTEVKKKTLFPLFDAKFQFSVPVEACKQPGAHLQMTVYDYDVLTDDMAGQVFATLNYVPGLDTEIPATFSGIEQVILPLTHPTLEGTHFEILKARSDEAAVKFVKRRQDLHHKMLLMRDKLNKRS